MTQLSLYKQDGKLRTDDPTTLTIWLREKIGYAFVEAKKVVAARAESRSSRVELHTPLDQHTTRMLYSNPN